MYLNWQEKIITDFSNENINKLYDEGFVFTRKNKGVMNQTRSTRISLDKFELSSENRRILKKTEGLEIKIEQIPYLDYSWKIGKMGKDFYENKFGKNIFSANKIKEILTNEKKSNFNLLFKYCLDKKYIGYCICKETDEFIHYSYPFYSNDSSLKNTGMSMMIRAVILAKKNNKKYIYLGSASNKKSLYKFQFNNIEWFNGKNWTNDVKKLKGILK